MESEEFCRSSGPLSENKRKQKFDKYVDLTRQHFVRLEQLLKLWKNERSNLRFLGRIETTETILSLYAQNF